MTEPRKAGKLGLIPKELPAKLGMMSSYMINPLGAPPPTLTWPASLSSCGMLGNGPDPSAPDYPNGVGDCTIAGVFHLRMLAAALCGQVEAWPSGAVTIAIYMSLSGGRDSGLVEADVLRAWRDRGLWGNKIAGYAPLDIANDDEIRAACALFGGTKVDVKVPANAMAQFDAGEPWHLDGSGADDEYEGGHSIVRCGYYVDKTWGPVWGTLTWARVQLATDEWMAKNVMQDWAVLTNEFVTADPHRVDVTALQADIAKLAA